LSLSFSFSSLRFELLCLKISLPDGIFRLAALFSRRQSCLIESIPSVLLGVYMAHDGDHSNYRQNDGGNANQKSTSCTTLAFRLDLLLSLLRFGPHRFRLLLPLLRLDPLRLRLLLPLLRLDPLRLRLLLPLLRLDPLRFCLLLLSVSSIFRHDQVD
jgi:hypothetical protein